MKQFLQQKCIKIPNPDHSDSDEILTIDPEVIEKIDALEQGGCIVLLDDDDAARLGLPSSTEAGGNVFVTLEMP